MLPLSGPVGVTDALAAIGRLERAGPLDRLLSRPSGDTFQTPPLEP